MTAHAASSSCEPQKSRVTNTPGSNSVCESSGRDSKAETPIGEQSGEGSRGTTLVYARADNGIASHVLS